MPTSSTSDLQTHMSRALCQSSYYSSHAIAACIAVFSAWKELLWAPVGACHRWIIAPPAMMIRPAPPFDVPSIVEPSVNSRRSACPLSAVHCIAALNWVAADSILLMFVLKVRTTGGTIQGGGDGAELLWDDCASIPSRRSSGSTKSRLPVRRRREATFPVIILSLGSFG